MFRFYWKTNRNQSSSETKKVNRIEGGYWFSEDSGQNLVTYKVLYRSEVTPVTYVEWLDELPNDFIETPCWKQDEQLWNLIQSDSNCYHWSLGEFELIEIPRKVCESGLDLLPFQLHSIVPDWIQGVSYLDYECMKREIIKYFEKILEQRDYKKKMTTNVLQERQEQQNHLSPSPGSQYLQQRKNSQKEHQRPQEGLVSQNHRRPEASKIHLKKQKVSGNLLKISEQHQESVVSFDPQKGLMIDSTLESIAHKDKQVDLPAGRHYSGSQLKRKQVRSLNLQECLILPS